MIEVVLDELKDYFRAEGFEVNFEIIDDLSVYVHFENNVIYDVDAFYKKITKVTHNFSNDVVALSRVDFVTMGEIYLLLSVDNYYESKKSARKSLKESKVDFQSVIDRVLPKEYAKNKNAYRYALSCVTSLYNEDEYDSDSAKVYFLNCYISDLFPSWIDELGEEEIDVFANALYYGTMKWSDIDSSWF